MGNSSQKLDALLGKNLCQESDFDEYKTIREKNIDIVGNPKLVKSQISGLVLEQYEVSANPNMTILQQINLYKLRSSSYSKNIAVVFYHKLLDEESKRFQVRIQKMICRLNQIVNLTCIQSLVILQQTLSGFIEIIQHSKVCFKVTDKMIAINEAGQLRVWGNQNFAVNGIQLSQVLPTQAQMLVKIEQSIKKHIDSDHLKSFEDCLKNLRKYQKLGEFKNFLLPMISSFNKKQVLFQITEKIIKKVDEEESSFTKSKVSGDVPPNYSKPEAGNFNILNEKIDLDLEQEQFQKIENKNIKYERCPKKDIYSNDKSNYGNDKSNYVYSVKQHKKILKNSPKNEEKRIKEEQVGGKYKYRDIFLEGNERRTEDFCGKLANRLSSSQVKNPNWDTLQHFDRTQKDLVTFQTFKKDSQKVAIQYPHQKSHPNQQNLIRFSKTEQIRKEQVINNYQQNKDPIQPQYSIPNPTFKTYQHAHSERHYPAVNLQKYPQNQQRPVSFFKDQPTSLNANNSEGSRSPKGQLPFQKSLISRSAIISRPKINFSNPSEIQLFYGNENKTNLVNKVDEREYQMKSQGFRKGSQLIYSKVEAISPSSTAHN